MSSTPLCLAQGQPQDFHLTADTAKQLYFASAFAHGHRHGYEDGFKGADEELQMGRLKKVLNSSSIPKSKSYKREYGDKKRFREGYVHGYLAGYDDSFDGRSFRLLQWSHDFPPFPAFSGLPQSDSHPLLDKVVLIRFDRGLESGYMQAIKNSAVPVEREAIAQQAGTTCKEQAMARETGYCEGFLQGFLIGADDKAARPASDQNVVATVADPQ